MRDSVRYLVSPLSNTVMSPVAVCTVSTSAEMATTVPRTRSCSAAAAVPIQSPAVNAKVSPRSRFMARYFLLDAGLPASSRTYRCAKDELNAHPSEYIVAECGIIDGPLHPQTCHGPRKWATQMEAESLPK